MKTAGEYQRSKQHHSSAPTLDRRLRRSNERRRPEGVKNLGPPLAAIQRAPTSGGRQAAPADRRVAGEYGAQGSPSTACVTVAGLSLQSAIFKAACGEERKLLCAGSSIRTPRVEPTGRGSAASRFPWSRSSRLGSCACASACARGRGARGCGRRLRRVRGTSAGVAR